MKKVLSVLLALLACGSITVFADESLPDIAPTVEVPLPPIDAPAPDNGN